MTTNRDATQYPVRRFKSLVIGLKELEPFIRSGEHLQSGKPFKQLHGMRSREAVANWLICVAANFAQGEDRMSFTSDVTGGDGIIYDSKTQFTWRTEHVMVRRPHIGELRGSILEKARLFLEKFAGFKQPGPDLWSQVSRLYDIRNIFVHSSGYLSRSSHEVRVTVSSSFESPAEQWNRTVL